MPFIAVFVGGGVGSLVRYLLSLWVGSLWGGNFPLGTFLINVTGCFLIGFLGGFSEKVAVDPAVRALLQTGFLGGFTTFSSFGVETFQLFRRGEAGVATLNVLGSNLIGLVMVALGFLAAKGMLNAVARPK
jgi:CrcB protein